MIMNKKYEGLITDIAGITVGHAQSFDAGTGVTAVLFDGVGAVCGADVRGSAPGTRETALLGQAKTVQTVNAIALCGGSAFGLDAAGGIMSYLEAHGMGVRTSGAVVPIVPAAVIYDLDFKRGDIRPDRGMGSDACKTAAVNFCQGSYGAGTGATVGKVKGAAFCSKGGIGSSCIDIGGGVKVGALFVVNAYGDITDNGRIIAGASENGVFIDSKKFMLSNSGAAAGLNTTIGIVATNAKLNRDEVTKLAQMGQNGICECVSPSHTVYDGDTVFAVSAGDKEAPLHYLTVAAQEAARRSIINAVLYAGEAL